MALHKIDTGKMVLHVSDEGLKQFDAAMKDQIKEWGKEEWSIDVKKEESGSNNNENLPELPLTT